MDSIIIAIETKWVEKVLNGEISREDMTIPCRQEVIDTFVEMGLMEAALTFKWKLAKN